ncbi:MAG: bacteriophage abortive infection AbiH family protein [Sphaerochaetaceae bacterium]
MKLYICGNGFDLHHGFKTSYRDYRDFLLNNYPDALMSFENCPYLRLNSPCFDRWSNLEDALTFEYEECMEDVLNLYYPDVLNDDSDSRWHNIGNELELQTEFVYAFTGQYFYEWFKTIDFFYPSSLIKMDKDGLFITFNYTEVLENFYHINPTNVMHIHGNLDFKNTSNLQFGSTYNDSDEIRNNLEKLYGRDDYYTVSIEPGVNEIISYCDVASKKINNNYEPLKRFISRGNIDELIIMGHSIIGLDYPYYRDIIVPMLTNSTKWIIYTRSEKDKTDAKEFLNISQISNYKLLEW